MIYIISYIHYFNNKMTYIEEIEDFIIKRFCIYSVAGASRL